MWPGVNDTAIDSPVVLAYGAANFSTADLPVGTNIILAVYPRDRNIVGSSNNLAQVISPDAETPTVLRIQANSDSTVTVSFSGGPDKQWVVQACADLAAPTWENAPTNVSNADGRWTFTEAMSTPSKQFYRATTP